MIVDKETLDNVNLKRLDIIKRVAKRTISKVQFTGGSELIANGVDDEKFEYLINKGIEKKLRGLGC
jgi:hypothetical protein